MGNFYYTKAALLDETDLECEGWPEAESLEDLWDTAVGTMSDLVHGEDVLFEPLALVSERFDAVCDMSDHYSASLIKDDWQMSLKEIASRFASLDDSMMDPFLKSGDVKVLENRMQSELVNLVQARKYAIACALITGLENLNEAELPGFRRSHHLSLGGDDEAYDLREKNHGPGRRLVLEYAVVWP